MKWKSWHCFFYKLEKVEVYRQSKSWCHCDVYSLYSVLLIAQIVQNNVPRSVSMPGITLSALREPYLALTTPLWK